MSSRFSPTPDGTSISRRCLANPPVSTEFVRAGGLLIQIHSHWRDRTSKLDKLLEKPDTELGGRTTEFLTAIRVDKSRYARDQFRLIHSLLDQYGMEAALQAIGFCQRSVSREQMLRLSDMTWATPWPLNPWTTA